jgi:4-hydroxybenzoate polyprenyltransferase
MIEAIKKLFVISRPISWLNTAYPFAAGYIISGGNSITVLIIGTFYFLVPYNLALYGINDVFDYESDIRNPRKGGIEGAVAAKKFHPTILWASLITNLPFIVVLVLLGSFQSAIFLVIILFFVIAYSIKKLRFKERPFLDSITSSMHFVGPLLYALSLTHFSPPAILFSIAFFIWGMASHAFGAVQDIIPDREAKLSSIATVLGARVTIRIAIVLYVIAAIIIMSQGYLAIIVGTAGLAYALNILAYYNITDVLSGSARPAWRRFIWINFPIGFVITIILILQRII